MVRKGSRVQIPTTAPFELGHYQTRYACMPKRLIASGLEKQRNNCYNINQLEVYYIWQVKQQSEKRLDWSVKIAASAITTQPRTRKIHQTR